MNAVYHPLCWLLISLIFLAAPGLRAGSSTSSNAPAAVAVELFHGLPDQLSWDYSVAEPAEAFCVPAFGLACLPARYSEAGVREDRPMPFLVRLSGEVSLP